MEEERSIRISRKRALRWYEKGGEFKELALQAYSEEELRPTVGEEVCAKMTEKYCRIFKFKVYGQSITDLGTDYGGAIQKYLSAQEFLLAAAACYNGDWKKKTGATKDEDFGYFIYKNNYLSPTTYYKRCGQYFIGKHQKITISGVVYFKNKEDAERVMEYMYGNGMLDALFNTTK